MQDSRTHTDADKPSDEISGYARLVYRSVDREAGRYWTHRVRAAPGAGRELINAAHYRSRRRQHDVRHAPAVPGGDRSPGPIDLTEPLELLGRRPHGHAMHDRIAPADSEVVDRPHIRPPELKDQEHMGGPAADPTHTRQLRDDLVVGKLVDPIQRHHAVDDLGRQIEQG